MEATVLGIDPGAQGAIAILDNAGNLLSVLDMPTTVERVSGVNRHATNAPLLAAILAKSHARIAFCEQVGARKTDGVVQAFAFGRARGVIEGICGTLNIPIIFISPVTWKAVAKVPPGVDNKDIARTRAIAKWPAYADSFALKTRVDRAEAALIAFAGLFPADSKSLRRQIKVEFPAVA